MTRQTARAGIDVRAFVLEMRRKAMAVETQTTVDPAQVEEFVGQVATDIAGTFATFACAIGDSLGLFRALAERPATAAELADRTGLNERYLREWAAGLVTAGYLDLDGERYSLPPARAAVLAHEGSPAFFGGVHQLVREMTRMSDAVESAFRDGHGVPLSSYSEAFWAGLERATAPEATHQLVQEWLPAVAGLTEALERGASVLDVGCGSGRAALTIARAFPAATIHGIDIHEPNIDRARAQARAAGLSDRVTFDTADALEGLGGPYDVVVCFNVVHDTVDPLALLRAMRAALAPGGVCVIQDGNAHGDPNEDRGPIGTMLYGFSLLHCLPQAIAAGGDGLGACGLTEDVLRGFAREAGFASTARVTEGPLNAVYELRP